MSLQSGLLPQEFEQFGSKEYWEQFFRERGEKAFEWYGTYQDLRLHVLKTVKKEERVLVVGCGNSDFSEHLYVQGSYHRVTNVDFSDTVVEEMKSKTRASCPQMEWRVMDVTDMGFADGEFDCVVDKGTLDAIYHTPENEPQAHRLLEEVARVVHPTHGRYLCVTLGQSFILQKLLERFGTGHDGWRLSLYTVNQPLSSPFLTLVAVASRGPVPGERKGEGAEGAGVALYFDALGKPVRSPIVMPPGDHTEVVERVVAAQERHRTKHELRDIRPGRFHGDIDIWLQDRVDTASSSSDRTENGPRYTFSIVDIVPATKMPLPCAVFLIPQGREHEWLFATPDGLRQVAQSADYQRMVCVRMNRGHTFQNMEEVKAELGPIVMDFVPAERDPNFKVPYLAVGDSIGSRNVVESGELPQCGQYCVEEEDAKDEGGRGAVIRRLVFLRNQNVIQSEIRMVPEKASGSGKGRKVQTSTKGSAKRKGKAKASCKATAADKDAAEPCMVVDWTYLAFGYHKVIIAGLGLMYAALKACKAQGRRPRGLIVGLGGGGLPLFMHRYVPHMDIVVLELEIGLLDVAKRWFGFVESDYLRVEATDGVERISGGPEGESWDMIVIDVDNSDASAGISCPGPSFVARDFLQVCRERLTADGMLCMNISARSTKHLRAAIESVRDVFRAGGGEVHIAQPSQHDVNRVLFALKTARSASASRASLSVQLQKVIEETVGTCNAGKVADPLDLEDCAGCIKPLADDLI